ncbi:protein JINGUBANG isoform X1 [Amaranthus tricolor]|uniref:protein JINGUBANG isoform X1 n=1 Tax=Amaranthus tricolor TaxID=29722 RepID=UPI00258C6E60|nr:protein JINGUBANG isoform X1 [Amaranthus tricolor]
MGLLHCPLPCHLQEENQSFDTHTLQSGYSSSSSSSSLTSQQSLQSLPSLSQSQQFDLQNSVHSQCISTLKGHTSYVFSLVLCGKHLYSGSYNNEIRVWPRELTANHQNPIENKNIVAVSNGAVKSLVALGDKLFSAHQDNKIRVWKIHDNNENHPQRYQCIKTLPTMNDRFLRLFFTKNYVEVRRNKSCTWVHHVDTVSALALSGDGSHLYSASWDRTFKVWRTSDFKCLESVTKAHDDAINALTLSKDGYVYTGSADKTIKVWKINQGEKKHSLVATLQKHKSAVNALALSSDGSVLYSGACDRSIVVWEREADGAGNMVVVGALRGHSNAILCLAVVFDVLFSGSADKTIRVWKRSSVDKSYTCLAVLEGHMKPVKCLTATIDPNNSPGSGTSFIVYSGSLDCDIKVWRIWVPFQ